MNKKILMMLASLLTLLFAGAAQAATCTTLSAGGWNTSSRWSCGRVPRTGDTVVIAHNVTMNVDVAANQTAASLASLTVNNGVTLTDDGNNRVITVTNTLVVNGTVSNGIRMEVTGAAATISGSGTLIDSRLYTTGTSVTVAGGSALNFTGSSRLYAGRTEGGNTVTGSVLTINGTINSTVTTASTTFMRFYANSSVIGATGVINAAVSSISYNTSAAQVSNNGSVSVNQVSQNAASNVWTQGTNSSLTVSAASSVGTLNASATGNTVTYNTPATPLTPSGNTYFNLAGTGVTCPHLFTVLGSNPCGTATDVVTVTRDPGSCVNTAGLGTVAWTPSPTTNANVSDNLYASATVSGTTNYLKCTGYGFAIPDAATILGVTVHVERKASRNTRAQDAAMRLVRAGTIGTINRITTTVYPSVDTIEPHGGAADLWGAAWTPADINVPTFGAAFASKTTRTRTLTVDHMPISVTYRVPANAPHHMVIEHTGSGKTCMSETLTVRACADAACTSNFTATDVSGNVHWAGSPGGDIPFSLVAGGSGQTTVKLPVTTAQTVTLSTASVTPAPLSATSCVNTSGGTSCNLTFTASALCIDAVEVGDAVGGSIFTKLSNTAFSLDLLTSNGGNYNNSSVRVELVDASAGACASYPSLGTQTVNFNNVNKKTVSFTYAGASKNTRVRVTGGASSSCSTDAFAIRPTGFTVTASANADATGASGTATPTLTAGSNFTLTATAVAGYNGTPLIDANFVSAHAGAQAVGAFTGSFGMADAATGVASATNFTYGEVGYFRFDARGISDQTFADIDALEATPECTPDASNTLVGGKYGCYIANQTATPYVGRFIPDHFNTVATNECDVFTYSGQTFPLEVQAMDAGVTPLQNYEGVFAKAAVLSDALNPVSPGSFSPATVAAADFIAGAAAVTPTFTFAVRNTAETAINVRATEVVGADGVSSATGTEGQINVRSGRIWIGNAYGSELLALSVPAYAQYWNGSNFITNTDDNVAAACTSIPVPTVGVGSSAATLNDPLVDGNLGLVLSAPGVAGQADLTLTVPAWLQTNGANPTARVTFGVYKGNNTFIYRGRRGR